MQATRDCAFLLVLAQVPRAPARSSLAERMLFIYSMWDNESQRIGKQKCTPLGYKLHGIAELLGFVGLLLLLAAGVYLGYRASRGAFHSSVLWVFAVPFGLGSVGEVLYWCSWRLAARKGFQYDYDKGQASWLEDGQRRVYKWTANESLLVPR